MADFVVPENTGGVDKGDLAAANEQISYGYIAILDTPSIKYTVKANDRVPFTFLGDSYTVQKSANYSSVGILGRSEPVRGYANSSARVVSLNISIPPLSVFTSPLNVNARNNFTPASTFFNDSSEEVGGFLLGRSSREGINSGQGRARRQAARQIMEEKLDIVNFFQSLVYPHYEPSSRIIAPPPSVLIVMGTWLNLKGIITSVNFHHHSPVDHGTGTPYFTDLSLTFEEADRPFSYLDIRQGYGAYIPTATSSNITYDTSLSGE